MANQTVTEVNYERGYKMGFCNARCVALGVEKPIFITWSSDKNFNKGFRAGRAAAASSNAMTYEEHLAELGQRINALTLQ